VLKQLAVFVRYQPSFFRGSELESTTCEGEDTLMVQEKKKSPENLQEAARKLCKCIGDEVVPGTSNARRRQLFGEMSDLRNKAEVSGASETLELLDAQRSALRMPKTKQNILEKASMWCRLFLTVFVAFWGALCSVLLMPLRVLNPLCRLVGIPHGMMPADIVLEMWAKAVLAAAGVVAKVDGGSGASFKANILGVIVYNHTSNLDPFLVNAACRLGLKYIGKKTLFMIPVIGWLFSFMGSVPINRGDPEKARATMNETVARIMKRWGRCVAIAPEGTRSTDGHLRLPFKKGVFHLQQQTKAPLLPIVLHGAGELWPPGRTFTSTGVVTMSFLPPVHPEEPSKDWNSHDATRVKLQRDYAEYLANKPDLGALPLSWMDAALCICRVVITLYAYSTLWSFLPSLGAPRWTAIFLAFGVFNVFFVAKVL
jgi:1-acyl-sn-glycerol-3-phosphate acyltransferase